MGRIKYEPVVQLKKTLSDLLQRWPLMLLVVLVDFVFLTFFGFIYKLYFDRIIAHATIIMQQTPTMVSAVQDQGIYASAPVVQQIAQELFEIKKLAFFLVISILVVWVAFQAFNWWNAFRISGRKTSYLQYLKTFAVTSVIWAAIVSLILYVSIQMFFAEAFSSMGASPNGMILNLGMALTFIVVGYFAIVSYSLTGRIRDVLKKTVLFSFLKSRVIAAYLIVIACAIVINLIIFGLFTLNAVLGMIMGIILLMLFFVSARVYMINVVQELELKKRKN